MIRENEHGERFRRRTKGKMWVGLIFLLVGGALLMRQLGYMLPVWMFKWNMILIIVGIFVGIQTRFRDLSWLILIVLGMAFLSDDIWPGMEIKRFSVPAIIIAVGLIIIFKPRSAGRGRRIEEEAGRATAAEENISEPFYSSSETEFDIVSVFGSVKKRALSKNFRGGEIVCIFGGSEINLTNADFISPIELDITQIFGGTTLIIPANWEVRSEIAVIFGGIDDKRPQQGNVQHEKVLILKGTSIFGGIEVKSY